MYGRRSIFTARKDGPLVKAEAVYMSFPYPIAEAVDDEFLGQRVITIDGVPASGKIHVVLGRPRHQQIVRAVIDAFETKRRSLVVAFVGVIEDYIQNNFYTRLVHGLDQIAELAQVAADFGPEAIGRLGREVPERAVSPEITEGLAVDGSEHGGLVEIKDRKQLDGCNAEISEVRNLLDESRKSPGMANARGRGHR